MIGKTISHYRISEKLGEGGMGIVYKAEDTKLERTVALKFLSLTSIGDNEKKRFKREAKAAAALNHPNIATIFAIDEAEGQTFIAMEFIEGKSIAELVGARGGVPLRIEDAIDYATQISAGLQAAHEKGIVHRDIKGANVMVTDKGVLKIMDFGLASLAGTSKVTQLGTTLGTAAYMPPEQARGEKADHRADIWALGVVLYEMVSGQLPFKGDYEQAVIYSILNEEPEPLTAIRTGVPMALEAVVNKMLRKRSDLRHQTAADVIADLKSLDLSGEKDLSDEIRISQASRTASSDSRKVSGQIASAVPWLLALTAILIAVWALLGRRDDSQRVLRTSAIFRSDKPLNEFRKFDLSPDGTRIAYVSTLVSDGARIWIRDLRTGEDRVLEGTENAFYPFWSPDGRFVGYSTPTALRVISAEGGSPRDVVPLARERMADWNRKDQIVYYDADSLYVVPAMGGEPDGLTATPEGFRGELSFHQNGDDFAAWGLDLDRQRVMYLGRLSDPSFDRLGLGAGLSFVGENRVVYRVDSPGNALFTQTIDLDRRQLMGTPVSLVEAISINLNYSMYVANPDVLIYQKLQLKVWGEYTVVDDRGVEIERHTIEGNYWRNEFSPDGRYLSRAGKDFLLYDFQRKVNEPISTAPYPMYYDWSPDAKGFIYMGFLNRELRERSIVSDEERVLLDSLVSAGRHPEWLPDRSGILIIHPAGGKGQNTELWHYSLIDGSTQRLLDGEANIFVARVSPDGQWIAYVAGPHSSDRDLFLRTFPEMALRSKISTRGGSYPAWSRDSKRLWFLNQKGRLEIVDQGKSGSWTESRVVSDKIVSYYPTSDDASGFSVYPDGKRVLIAENALAYDLSEIVVWTNWQSTLEK